ncbi:FecCD family ABC transporter permease [Streptomyces sp. TP-A0874]|uniref:FecCD family ABC transporter permease n=1 Tax=Streptomyces sp. TP-A0874 TaxID=549819 RepID=UPI000852A208
MTPEQQERPASGTGPKREGVGRRTVVLRRGGLSLRFDVRTLAVCAVLAAACLLVALVSLASGDFTLSLPQVVTAIFDGGDFAHTVVVEWRMPRILAALVFGAALAVSGAIFQSLTRNFLASPDIIGFSTGSYTGALVVIIVIGGSYLEVAAGALVGGMATAAVVFLLTARRSLQGFRLIVVGIAVSAMLASLNTWMMLRAELDVAMTAAVWGAGTLNGIGWQQTGTACLAVAVLLVLLGQLVRPLRQLEMGDDAARSLGVPAEPVRLGLVLIGVALVATVSAAAGPITFVALAAPQIARRLTKTSGLSLAPAALLGALLLSASDYAAQHALSTALPVGVVTVVIGGCYLAWMLVHEARKRL